MLCVCVFAYRMRMLCLWGLRGRREHQILSNWTSQMPVSGAVAANLRAISAEMKLVSNMKQNKKTSNRGNCLHPRAEMTEFQPQQGQITRRLLVRAERHGQLHTCCLVMKICALINIRSRRTLAGKRRYLEGRTERQFYQENLVI